MHNHNALDIEETWRNQQCNLSKLTVETSIIVADKSHILYFKLNLVTITPATTLINNTYMELLDLLKVTPKFQLICE